MERNWQMNGYWGLRHLNGSQYLSTDTLPPDNQPIVPRSMPIDAELTAWEVLLIDQQASTYKLDQEWYRNLVNYSEALQVICAHWLHSCIAQHCVSRANKEGSRYVQCPAWEMTLECLHESRLSKNGKLGDVSRWQSRWSYLTDKLPPLPDNPYRSTQVVRRQWFEAAFEAVSVIGHIAEIALSAVESSDKEENESGNVDDHKTSHWQPRRVGGVLQCKYPLSAVGEATPYERIDGSLAELFERIGRGEYISAHINSTTHQAMDSKEALELQNNTPLLGEMLYKIRVGRPPDAGSSEVLAQLHKMVQTVQAVAGLGGTIPSDIQVSRYNWSSTVRAKPEGRGHQRQHPKLRGSTTVKRAIQAPMLGDVHGHGHLRPSANAGILAFVFVFVICLTCLLKRRRRTLAAQTLILDDLECNNDSSTMK